jgi:ElaA protein
VTGQDAVRLHTAWFRDLDVHTLYALLKLRVDVFVVEQECAYAELDGRDTHPATRHLWFDDASHQPLAYLRLLEEQDGSARIGRVAVASSARGTGLAGQLIEAALELAGDRRCVLDAQSHLVGLYRRYGFSPVGPEYVEDGIPHVPMARPGAIRDHST